MRIDLSYNRAVKAIRGIVCSSLDKGKFTLKIGRETYTIVPRIIIIETGAVLKYKVRLYTVSRELLDANIVTLVSVISIDKGPYKGTLLELTLTAERDEGRLYIVPSSLANKLPIDDILKELETRGENCPAK